MSISISDGNLVIENDVLTKVNPKAEKVIIPKYVRKIRMKAFDSCTNLKKIEFEPGGNCMEVESCCNPATVIEWHKGVYHKFKETIAKEIEINIAKKEKMDQIAAISAAVLLKNIAAQYNLNINQYQNEDRMTLVIYIGDSGIELSLPSDEWVSRKDDLQGLFSFISSGASVSEIAEYCIQNKINFASSDVKDYAIIADDDFKLHIGDRLKALTILGNVTKLNIKLKSNSDLIYTIDNITFCGTKAQWRKVKGKGIFKYCDNTIVHCSDGDVDISLRFKNKSLVSCNHFVTTVKIPNGVETIFMEAFNNCKRIQSIEIPASVKQIAVNGKYSNVSYYVLNIFSGLHDLKSVTYDGTISQWRNVENYNMIWARHKGYPVQCTDGLCYH